MKIKRHLSLLILTLAMSSLVAPMAFAKCCKSRCAYKNTGVIYNEMDGRYYPTPSAKGGMVYRSVDGKLIPVSKKSMVSVRCETRPGYWWMTTWMPASNECYYLVR